MIVRNDDVAADTVLEDLMRFNSICDEYNFCVIQCITPLGITRPVDVKMSNVEIVALGGHTTILNNHAVVNYLKQRNDPIGVHGLWHTHEPSEEDIRIAAAILREVGLTPSYFATPFNEGSYPHRICGLTVSSVTDCLEHFIDGPLVPTTEIVYTHAWRWGLWYPWEKLEACLKKITRMT